MSDGWQPGGLDGVLRRTLAVNRDGRGSFAELWRDGWRAGLPDVPRGVAIHQANLSRSAPRVLRGLHMHRRQAEIWIVVDGHPLIALVDARPVLARTGTARVEMIEATAGDVLYVPEGVAHGFYARDPITLLYFVTNEYDGTDELGFAWDDATVGVPWPDPAPILSPRDATAPSFQELVARLRIR